MILFHFFRRRKNFANKLEQRKCIFFAEREQNAKRKRNPKKGRRRTCLAKNQLRSAKGVEVPHYRIIKNLVRRHQRLFNAALR